MNDQHYAVVVGIDRYPGVRDLTSARNDARRFAEWLKREDGGGVPEENLKLILFNDEDLPEPLELQDAAPRFQQIEDDLFDLRLRCEEHVADEPLDWRDTRLYLYVSGHGIAPAPDEAALLMANAAPQRFGRNLSCDKFLEFFKAAQTFHELVFFADCCRERVSSAPIQAPTWDRVEGHNGPVVALPGYATHFGDLAFEADEEDNEDPDQRRSYFTQALLEGLEGKAVNENGEIDSTSLSIYVTDRVRALTSHKPRPQVPTMLSDPAAPIFFRRGLPLPAAAPVAAEPVTIRFPPGFAGRAVLTNGALEQMGIHDAGQGPWVLHLPRGLYEIAPQGGGANPFANEGRFKVLQGGLDVQL
ncbi:MAG: caspase family protein [Acidobacteria bacterium]|nr:caspase family protein [Acidobacteriota bacterium]